MWRRNGYDSKIVTETKHPILPRIGPSSVCDATETRRTIMEASRTMSFMIIFCFQLYLLLVLDYNLWVERDIRKHSLTLLENEKTEKFNSMKLTILTKISPTSTRKPENRFHPPPVVSMVVRLQTSSSQICVEMRESQNCLILDFARSFGMRLLLISRKMVYWSIVGTNLSVHSVPASILTTDMCNS